MKRSEYLRLKGYWLASKIGKTHRPNIITRASQKNKSIRAYIPGRLLVNTESQPLQHEPFKGNADHMVTAKTQTKVGGLVSDWRTKHYKPAYIR